MSPQMDISGNKLGIALKPVRGSQHAIQDDYDDRFWLLIAILWNIGIAMKLEWLSGLT